MQKSDSEALNNYWKSQPELQDPDFLSVLSAELEKKKNDPSYRIIHIWELAKYRLRKLLPPSMPFEERKNKFITSEAWNCWVNQNNEHLAPEELTIDNIDKEIESVGIRWGMDIENRCETSKWSFFAVTGAICEVYIP